MKALLSHLALLTILPLATSAQTALWLAPGPNHLPADWHDPANWDTGVVPNAPDAVAVLPAYPSDLASQNLSAPGAGPALIGTGDVSLAELRWQLDGTDSTQTGANVYIGTYTGSGATTGALHLHGAGLTSVSPVAADFQAPTVSVINGMLEFNGSASAGAMKLYGIESTFSLYTATSEIRFRDQSTAGNAEIDAGGTLTFRDQSTAAQSKIHSHSRGNDGNAYLSFHDQASAGEAQVTIGPNTVVTFNDSATAAQARFVTDPIEPFLGGRWLFFRDQSTAGQATFTLNDSLLGEFTNDATAGQATFALTDQVGLTFRDSANAAQAAITGRGNILFRDSASAGQATITGYHVIFRDNASAGTASLAPAFDLATSSIEFRDHSSAAAATLNLGKLGRVVFADDSDAGTATVAIGSGASEGLVVIRDRARANGLGILVTPGGSGRLDISQADQDVELRTLSGNVRIDLGERSLLFTDSIAAPGSLDGKISGDGGITWDRPATLTISSPENDFTGTTRVVQGTLRLDHGRLADLEIGAAATLTGVGQMSGSLRNDGTVAPGHSPGTLQVAGDYLQTATGGLNLEIQSASEYDRLHVAGAATLDGTLTLSFRDDYVPVGSTTFDFLSAGSINGQFSTLQLPLVASAALSSQLQYTAAGVSLVVTQHPFAGFGDTPAASALGAHLDATLATATGSYRDLIAGLNTLDAASLAAALAALAPDRYAVLPEHGHLTAVAQQAARDRRLAALRTNPSRGFALYFEAGRRSADFDARDGLPDAESAVSHGTVGGEWRNGAFSLGASLTQESGDLELDALGSRADLESLVPAAFLQYTGDRFFLNAAAAFSRDDYDLRRHIAYPGSNLIAAAAPSGHRTDLALTAGHTIRLGAWTLAPQVGLLHSDWVMSDLRETGAAGADLSIPDWSVRSLRTRTGLEAGRPGPVFSPRLTVFWLHETRSDRSLPAAFAGADGTSYTAPGRPAGRNLVQAALGFDWQLGKRAVLHATLASAWGSQTRLASDLSAGIRWEF